MACASREDARPLLWTRRARKPAYGVGGGDGGGGVGLSAGWQSMLVLQGLAPGLWFNRRKACWQVLKQSETPLHTL